jgi:hypothetical protein
MLNFFHHNRTSLKQVAYILIASTILLQSLSSAIIIAGYAINTAYITKAFCENKDKPMMHCNGKCHLKKQLNEEKEKDQNPSSVKDKREITQFSESNSEYLFGGQHCLSSIVPPETELPAQDFHPLIFHPPVS